MHDHDRLQGSDDGRPPIEEPLRGYDPTSRISIIGIAVLLTAVAVGLWWWASGGGAPATRQDALAPAGDVVERRVDAVIGLGIGEPDPDLPELGAMDSYVRPILAALSRRPELASLLATDGLVRRFAVSVEGIARGASPARQVRAVAPSGAFEVERSGDGYVIAASSYERYAGLVRLIEDLDPQDLARIYGRLKPRLEDAHAELGVPATLDETMEQALRHLLQTPELVAGARVKQGKGTNYVYVDPALEGLSPAQRQLLRLGPDHAVRVKARLREFALALGIDEARLPSAT